MATLQKVAGYPPPHPTEIELDAPTPVAPGAPAVPVPGGEAAVAPTGGGICEIDPSACPKAEDVAKAAKKTVNAEIYAVQQIYALRTRRFELQPYWSVSLNDQFVTHTGPGLAANYYITNVLAIGLNDLLTQEEKVVGLVRSLRINLPQRVAELVLLVCVRRFRPSLAERGSDRSPSQVLGRPSVGEF